MKKKLLLCLAAFIIVATTTLGIVLYRANDIVASYKPQIETMMSEALGARAKIGDLKLSILPRPKIFVSKLNIDETQGKQSGVSVGSLEAQASVWPLLSKKLEISAVTIIKPRISLQKTPTGMTVKGISPQQSTQKTSKPDAVPSDPTSRNTSAKLGISIQRIIIRQGQLEIEDTTSRNKHTLGDIELDMGVDLTDNVVNIPHAALSLLAQGVIPVSMKVANATFNKSSGAANLPECTVITPPGTIKIMGTTSSPKAGSLSLSAESLDVAKLVQMAATFSPAVATFKPAGQLKVALDHDIGRGVTNIKTAQVLGFGGSISAPSTITLGTPVKAATQLDITNISVAEIVAAFAPNLSGTLEGTITKVRANLSEIASSDPANTATGSGDLLISNGAIKGLNIPGQALAKIDSLPFISGNLRQRVPAEFESLFAKPDTLIKQLSSNVLISRGVLQLSDFNLESDFFSVRGGGTYSLLGEANVKSELILNPVVSLGITNRVKELQPLLDSRGQLVLPMAITGKMPAIIVTPDVSAILKKASAAGVAQALDKVLKDKKVGGKIGKILGF